MPKIKIPNVRIRPTILFVFITVVLISLTITLSLQYYFSLNAAKKSVNTTIENLSENTFQRLQYFDNTSYDLISLIEFSPNIKWLPYQFDDELMRNKLSAGIKNKAFIYSVYIGFENGNFYQLINLNTKSLQEKFNAKPNERWLNATIIKEDGKAIRTKRFFTSELELTRTIEESTTYNPNERPWYVKAKYNEDIIKTKPYLFSNLNSQGITYGKRINYNNEGQINVIGIDVSLQSITDFFKERAIIKGSQFYLANEKGDVVTSNIDNSINNKKIKNTLAQVIKERPNSIHIDNTPYFISNKLLVSIEGEKEYLSIFIPKKEVMKPYVEKILYAIAINIVFILLLLPVIWYIVKLIVQPIQELEKENEKIKNRDYEQVKEVSTPIYEVYSLSKSLVEMSTSIQAHEKAQVKLMDSFIELIASAIDTKSQYTGAHCKRVPILTLMIAEAASNSKQEAFKEFEIKTEEEQRELSTAAWLHDCGKITTPEYVVDKATKLETIYNRIHEIRMRFEVIYRDLIIESYEKLNNNEDKKVVDTWLKQEHQQLIEDFEFIAQTNIGGEFLSKEDQERIKVIAQRTWNKYFDDSIGLSKDERERYVASSSNEEYLLSDKQQHIIPRINFDEQKYKDEGFKLHVPEHLYNLGEVYNLSISRGTLTNEERFKINEHIIMSIKMLEQLPFPDYLQRVPEFAGAHHETLIGTGYPKELTKDQMSIPARIMAIADVFEALTATDRPYKETKKLSDCIKILSFMVKDQHLDADLFRLFLEEGIYMQYAKEYLLEEQIDEINIQDYLG